ncbi:hypothetical protein LTR08_005239 [Meristemomyces frigidus]|nr:hypothetical protein LTR08_005239 [Meristemomyces frigidus]
MPPLLLPSKSRRVRFTLDLTLHDLNNVPLVSGTSFIKWHLPASTAAEHRGRTPKCPIQDHRVLYTYTRTLPVRMSVNKSGILNPSAIDFEVLQEYLAGGRGERISLGKVSINLAEYVESGSSSAPASASGQEAAGVVRRYLMQESKINSTLKIGIRMTYIDGTREFSAPPLRSAPVFGGIAGIISATEPSASTTGLPPSSSAGPHAAASQQDLAQEEAGAVPSLSATNREMGEMQDMYRRTLAAHWAALPGVLKADECVEDIFSGGDGWGKDGRPGDAYGGVESGGGSAGEGAAGKGKGDGEGGGILSHGAKMSTSGRGTTGQHKYSSSGKYGPKRIGPRKGPGEIDELDVREDLGSWMIGEKAYG